MEEGGSRIHNGPVFRPHHQRTTPGIPTRAIRQLRAKAPRRRDPECPCPTARGKECLCVHVRVEPAAGVGSQTWPPRSGPAPDWARSCPSGAGVCLDSDAVDHAASRTRHSLIPLELFTQQARPQASGAAFPCHQRRRAWFAAAAWYSSPFWVWALALGRKDARKRPAGVEPGPTGP